MAKTNEIQNSEVYTKLYGKNYVFTVNNKQLKQRCLLSTADPYLLCQLADTPSHKFSVKFCFLVRTIYVS